MSRALGTVRMVFEADEEGHLSIGLFCAELRAVTSPDAGVRSPRRGQSSPPSAAGSPGTPLQLAILLPRR